MVSTTRPTAERPAVVVYVGKGATKAEACRALGITRRTFARAEAERRLVYNKARGVVCYVPLR